MLLDTAEFLDDLLYVLNVNRTFVGMPHLLYYVIGGGVTLLFVSAQPFGGGFGRDQNIAGRNLKPKGKKTS